jgi:hypothetical protein
MMVLPFIEQSPLKDGQTARISDPAARLPSAWDVGNNTFNNTFWKVDVKVYFCPSDSKPTNRGESPSLLGYKVCVGDDYEKNHHAPNESNRVNRGVFGFERYFGFSDIKDGASNTIILGESVTGGAPDDVLGGVAVNVRGWSPQVCLNQRDPNNPRKLRPVGGAVLRADFRPTGGRAWEGRPYFCSFATMVAPNGPSCQWGNPDGNEHMGALSSFHPGGGLVAFVDGRVKFISQTINVGNQTIDDWPPDNRSGASPYGVWGALGSKDGGEAVANQ